jgi:hypothetical protein
MEALEGTLQFTSPDEWEACYSRRNVQAAGTINGLVMTDDTKEFV